MKRKVLSQYFSFIAVLLNSVTVACGTSKGVYVYNLHVSLKVIVSTDADADLSEADKDALIQLTRGRHWPQSSKSSAYFFPFCFLFPDEALSLTVR